MEKLIERLSGRFTIEDVHSPLKKQSFITVTNNDAVPMITYLRDVEGFTHLSFLTAVDYIEDGHFMLHYLLRNPENQNEVSVKTPVSREDARMDSIHHLWAAAGTYQRELYEMFGIDFPDSPRLEEPFVLESWKGIPPMRREFDTKEYSEQTFFPRPGRHTKDPARHMAEKLSPEAGV